MERQKQPFTIPQNNFFKIPMLWLIFIFVLVFCAGPVWAKSPINTTWLGVAVKGYDVVAYFTQSKAVKGIKDYEFEWKGAKWRFSTADHLEMFKKDPEKYAPQYGGY